MPQPTHDAVMEALARVIDPELHRPITDLGMVSTVDIAEDGVVSVEVLLTVAGCPLKDTITADTQREVGSVEGVTGVQVSLGVMSCGAACAVGPPNRWFPSLSRATSPGSTPSPPAREGSASPR